MLKILGVDVVKNGCGQSCDGTLKLTLSEEWKNGINLFFACWCRFITVKSWSKYLLSGHGQKWVWPVWSWDSKFDCISKLNQWNNLIFCMLVQMQEGWKLIQSFLSVPCQKWHWLFISWNPKTYILKMNIWIKLIILMLIVMQ